LHVVATLPLHAGFPGAHICGLHPFVVELQ
jgi:hypothetical protein